MNEVKNDKVKDAEIVKENTIEQVSNSNTPEGKMSIKKQNQNLMALSIVLLGLFLGSIFVDFVQLIRREGFSLRALQQASVVEMAGKTWVSYTDPKIQVKVLTDATCTACNADQALVSLRKAMPTLDATVIDITSPEGKKLADQEKVKSLPAFFFSPSIEKSSIYVQAGPVFSKIGDGWYALDTAKVGMPAGKFLELPTINSDALVLGNPDSKVKVVEFSDWECPYCKVLQSTINQMLSEYKDKVYYAYIQFPLTSIHPQAMTSAMAVECANEQGAGKWYPYGDNLFATQADWSKTTGTQKFKEYAAKLKLDVAKFSQCLDSKKYADKIAADQAQGESFGISGTPGVFVNGQFFGGVVDYSTLKKAIDDELAK